MYMYSYIYIYIYIVQYIYIYIYVYIYLGELHSQAMCPFFFSQCLPRLVDFQPGLALSSDPSGMAQAAKYYEQKWQPSKALGSITIFDG